MSEGRAKRERKSSSKLSFAEEQAAHHETKKRAPAKKKSSQKVQVVIEKRKAPPKYKALKVRKPSTAFMFFSKAMKDGVQGDFPDATVNERTKIVNELWAELPEPRRARWESLAEKDQMRFEREKAAIAK